jgi:hypothetical protein
MLSPTVTFNIVLPSGDNILNSFAFSRAGLFPKAPVGQISKILKSNIVINLLSCLINLYFIVTTFIQK